jgi:hypothetical protein
MANFTVPQGDPMHGEKEILEPAYDAEVTRAADEQRAFAQRDEVEDYPGDSGKQAAARVKADAYHGLGGLAKRSSPTPSAAPPASRAASRAAPSRSRARARR